MAKKEQMIGKKYDRWTVESFSHVREKIYNGKVSKKHVWNVICDCGNKKQLTTTVLNRGDSKSCGCIQKEKAENSAPKIRKGKTFGYLTVLEVIETGKWGVKCSVKCICGKEFIANGKNLRKDNMNYSCGCVGLALNENSTGFNSVLSSYKQSAKVRKIEFDLSILEFKKLLESPCFYCKKSNSNNNRGFLHNGIDRIDSNLGYNLENTVSCCKQCNISKSTMTQEEYRQFIERVYNEFVKGN